MASSQPETDWQSTKTTVSERNRHMFNNSDMSDISFTCEGSDKIFYAHKYVLGISSAVFHAMFYGDLAEKNSVVHLSDTDENSFEEFMRFLYTDKCNLTTDNVISVMYLSKKYIVPSLTEYVTIKLIRSITPGNVLDILEQTINFEEKELEKTCWEAIEWRTSDIVEAANFVNIKQTTLASLLKRNHLNVSEINLFQAVLRWINHQCLQKGLALTTNNRRSVIGDAVYDLRFLALSEEEFAKHVSQSGLLTTDEIVPIYENFNKLESPLLKWKLSERKKEKEETFVSTNETIRVSRFSVYSISDPYQKPVSRSRSWQYYGTNSFNPMDGDDRDYLSFSVDRCALFLGVRLFSAVPVVQTVRPTTPSGYDVHLKVSVGNIGSCETSGRNYYGQSLKGHSVPGFDVMLKSPILVQRNQIVKISASIRGPPSVYGRCGKSTIKVRGVTVNFSDSSGPYNTRTCVSQGQFHEIILSV